MLQASGIVLAGGRSSRMGVNKAFLAVGKEKMIEHVIREFRRVFSEVIVVTNEPSLYASLEARVITDLIPGMGPLSGIHAGLAVSSNRYNFIAACDMPFLDHRVAAYLVREAPGFDVVVPQERDYLQPLHAVYSKTCLKPIEKCLRNGIFKIIAFYPEVKVKFVGTERLKAVAELEKVFYNVNTPRELELARRLFEEQNGKQQ